MDVIEALNRIHQLSHAPKMPFDKKLQNILDIIVTVMKTRIGSIMLVKGRKHLEVVASTNPDLIGYKQLLAEDTHSSRVVRQKTPLYSRNQTDSSFFQNNANRYKKEAFYIVPILKGKAVIGVINVTEKKDSDHYTQKERECLLTISGSLIGAIENHRLNQTLITKKQHLKEKNTRLQRVEQMRSELFEVLIQDLEGPMAEIFANLDILSYESPQPLLPYVTSAQTSCEAATGMISDMLDIFQLESNSIHLIEEIFDPLDIILETKARLDGLIRMKHLKIAIVPREPDTRATIKTDRTILLRVMRNLLINAIHFSPEGGTVQLGFHQERTDRIVFHVKDAGPGIPREYHEAIFDKFFKIVHKDVAKRYGGGLGLTFCKMAVERLGGGITVESDGRSGTCFQIFL